MFRYLNVAPLFFYKSECTAGFCQRIKVSIDVCWCSCVLTCNVLFSVVINSLSAMLLPSTHMLTCVCLYSFIGICVHTCDESGAWMSLDQVLVDALELSVKKKSIYCYWVSIKSHINVYSSPFFLSFFRHVDTAAYIIFIFFTRPVLRPCFN